jgi:hypothetical protein
MTTPSWYTFKRIEKVPGLSSKKFYHWTDDSRFQLYLREGYIYSKGSLWGLGHTFNRRATTKEDAENGFIDYVYIGMTNWIQKGMKSYYGKYGFELHHSILFAQEFFNYPFNTGNHFKTMNDSDKFSDLSTLQRTIFQTSGEIVLRRRIQILPKFVNKIICPAVEKDAIIDAVKRFGIQEDSVMTYNAVSASTQKSPKLFIEFGPFVKSIPVPDDNIVIEGEDISVNVPDSESILALKIDGKRVLLACNNQPIGHIDL